MKLKIPNLLKQLGTMIQQNYWCFYPSELIYFALFSMSVYCPEFLMQLDTKKYYFKAIIKISKC